MKTIAIIQARTTSKRFPNKILKKIKGKTLIEILILRLMMSRKIDQIIVAIPKNNKQLLLKQQLKKINVNFFEGNEYDVLDRYYQAAKKFKTDFILRITADCPLIDFKIIDKLITIAEKGNYDFVSNCHPPTFPDGLDASVISHKTLKQTWKSAKSEHDREHVVPYIERNKKFKKHNLEHSKNLANERWTVDEPEDFVVVENIFKQMKNFVFPWEKILDLKNKKPKLFEANKHILRDEGSKISSGQKLWKRAKSIIPGGNMLLSKRPDLFLPERWPAYFNKAKGCKIWDLDGQEYLDMSIMGIGTNILGYGHPEVDEAVKKNIDNGNMSTLNCPEEVYLSEKLIQMHPWAEMVKFTRTGGEANAVAIRISRASSSRDKVAICGYHGWHDWYLAANIKDKKNLSKHLLPDLKIQGVPKALKNSVFAFQYNNITELEKIIKKHNIGTVKMEVSKNLAPEKNFLQQVRKITKEKKINLIFDECTSGFRENFGGLHKKYGVEPDMAIFGKALGNGYAINAIIGKKKIMESAQSSFISSTFWTERVGPTAALKTLEVMEQTKSWIFITNQGKYIKKKWQDVANKYSLKIDIWGLDALAGFTIISINSMKYKTFITQEMLKHNILASNIIYLCTEHSTKLINEYFYYLKRIFKIIAECENGRSIDNLLETPVSNITFKRLN